jgi:pimeloyl-ACP methyl ester carboxylesterase
MPQLVFIHGPGAGACADAYHYQLEHFAGSVAPHLPGHLEGTRCPDVARYTEWVRGWLWAQRMNKDLVLVGYTLGASIGLQYGLDYPEEVKASYS